MIDLSHLTYEELKALSICAGESEVLTREEYQERLDALAELENDYRRIR